MDHVDLGSTALRSGCRDSQMKKSGNRRTKRRKGTRNCGVRQPYDAPNVRPMMRRRIERKIDEEPTKSRRFQILYFEGFEED